MVTYQVWTRDSLEERSLLVDEEYVSLQGGRVSYEYRYSELRCWEQHGDELALLRRGSANGLRLVAASEVDAERIVEHIGACARIQSGPLAACCILDLKCPQLCCNSTRGIAGVEANN